MMLDRNVGSFIWFRGKLSILIKLKKNLVFPAACGSDVHSFEYIFMSWIRAKTTDKERS